MLAKACLFLPSGAWMGQREIGEMERERERERKKERDVFIRRWTGNGAISERERGITAAKVLHRRHCTAIFSAQWQDNATRRGAGSFSVAWIHGFQFPSPTAPGTSETERRMNVHLCTAPARESWSVARVGDAIVMGT